MKKITNTIYKIATKFPYWVIPTRDQAYNNLNNKKFNYIQLSNQMIGLSLNFSKQLISNDRIN